MELLTRKKKSPLPTLNVLAYKPFYPCFYLLLMVFSLFFIPSTQAGTEKGGFTITSDRLEMDEKKKVAMFIGDVRAEEKQMRLAADKMTVYYFRSKKKGHQGGVRQVEAQGHVTILQGESQGSAEQMIYKPGGQTLELYGQKKDAVIQHGEDLLSGKRIILTIDSNRVIQKVSVQGGGKKRRVSARIVPSSEDKKQPRTTHNPLKIPSQQPPSSPIIAP